MLDKKHHDRQGPLPWAIRSYPLLSQANMSYNPFPEKNSRHGANYEGADTDFLSRKS